MGTEVMFEKTHPITKIDKTKADLLTQIEEGLTHISNEQIRLESVIRDMTHQIAVAEKDIEWNAKQAKDLQILRDALGANNGDQQ